MRHVSPSSSVMARTEWLPNNKDYEIAAGYNIEMYSDSSGCKNVGDGQAPTFFMFNI